MKRGDRRALLLLGGAALLFLALQFLVLPALDRAQAVRGSLPMKEKTLRKYQQLTVLAPARETDWQAVQARVADAEKRLLSSRTPALAAAEMQDFVKQLLGQQGIEMRGADLLPARAVKRGAATYVAVPLSLSFDCRLDQLTNFLVAARSGTKLLAVDSLTVAPVAPPRKTVAVRLVLHGLMPAEPPAERKS